MTNTYKGEKMEEITRYQCPLCGTNYETAEDCEECMNFHIEDWKVVKQEFHRRYKTKIRTRVHSDDKTNDGRYPSKLIVHFDTDEPSRFVNYVFDKSFSDESLVEEPPVDDEPPIDEEKGEETENGGESSEPNIGEPERPEPIYL